MNKNEQTKKTDDKDAGQKTVDLGGIQVVVEPPKSAGIAATGSVSQIEELKALIKKEAKLAQKRTVDVKNALSNHARRYHPDGPMSPQPSPRALREYIVTSDDHSLSLIAKKLTTNSGRFTEMATLNKITHPFTIEPGQVLLIPPTW